MPNERDWDADWAICEAATPGPWYTIDGMEIAPSAGPKAHVELCRVAGERKQYVAQEKRWITVSESSWYNFEEAKANAHFIAESRSALPYWLQRVKELEIENARLQTVIKAVEELAEHRHEEIVPIDLIGKLIDTIDAYKEVSNL